MNHLEGIRVLSEKTIESTKNVIPDYVIILTLVILAFIICGIGCYKILKDNKDNEHRIGLLTIFTYLVVAIFTAYIMNTVFTTKYKYEEYKVIIEDNSVTYEDFTNTYNVLNKDGEIYTVTFKEEDSK